MQVQCCKQLEEQAALPLAEPQQHSWDSLHPKVAAVWNFTNQEVSVHSESWIAGHSLGDSHTDMCSSCLFKSLAAMEAGFSDTCPGVPGHLSGFFSEQPRHVHLDCAAFTICTLTATHTEKWPSWPLCQWQFIFILMQQPGMNINNLLHYLPLQIALRCALRPSTAKLKYSVGSLVRAPFSFLLLNC